MDPIKQMLANSDILMCQEILLLEEDCHLLYSFDEDFDVIFKPSAPPSGLGDGRPIGGLAIFYRKSLDMRTKSLIEHDSFLVLNLNIIGKEINVVNVYMPSEDRTIDAHVKYQHVLGELQTVLQDSECDILFAGDFNASHLDMKRFSLDLMQFIEINSLVMKDAMLPNDSFTYLSSAHNTTSWIDHVITSNNLNISNMKVMYEKALYDHFPMYFLLKIDCQYEGPNNISNPSTNDIFERNNINWKPFKNSAIRHNYNRDIVSCMNNIQLCNDMNCKYNHNSQIDDYYNRLIQAFKFATRDYEQKARRKFRQIPGWNDLCKQKYRDARKALITWVQHGKNREGVFYEEMKRTRKLFKNALKFCKYNEQQVKDNILAKKVLKNNPSKFWRETRNRLGKLEKSRPEAIDEIKDPKLIADRFAEKFSAITGNTAEIAQNDILPENNNDVIEPIQLTDLRTAISSLNKCVGIDGIHTNHLKFSNANVLKLIVEFYNACLIHSHIPSSMLKGVITPRLKNKFGNKKDSSNYREVMISTNFMKCLEYLLLPSLIAHSNISPMQYGYRSNTSTTLAVATLKEVLHKYIRRGNSVYSCFLDLSKAFETVNHDLLIQKIRNSGLKGYMTTIIHKMLTKSTSCVNYFGHFSKSWSVSKGVRQGGVLSAYLFSIYVDQILREVSRMPAWHQQDQYTGLCR